MNTISAEIVEQTWEEMSVMSPSKIPKIMDQLTKKHPIILAYLMASGNDILNQDERELLLYLGIVVWRIMSQGNTPLPEVPEDILDEVESKNFNMLEYLEGESETDFFDAVELITNNYNQPEVLKYVVEALMEDDDEEIDISDENKGMMMIYLKTVIDCLDR